MRKYKILVLTNNPTEAHETVLKKTFGKRQYSGVTSRVGELILKYDDAEVTIKRYSGGSLDSMRGYRWDEVWIDEYVGATEEDLRTVLYTVGVYKKDIQENLPHYANRTKVNYFRKWE